MTIHSPLGASSAERWMNCPGSVALIQALKLEATDDPEYRKLGTAAHAAAAHITLNDMDAWEVVGQKFEDVEVDVDMADAIQVHKDFCAGLLAEAKAYMSPSLNGQHQFWLEMPVDFCHLHPDGYGTVDFGVFRNHVTGLILDVVDYKHGEGIFVEVENNEQEMYYAFALLQRIPEEMRLGIKVRLTIIQPRITYAEPVRTWETTSDHIIEWAMGVLLPAMNRTELDHGLDVGEHCRFCPAKLICPALVGLFKAACTADPLAVVNVTTEQLSLAYHHVQGVKFYIKALEEQVFARLDKGIEMAHAKLVNKKANRVWVAEAAAVFKERFGPEAFTAPELKSPAEMSKIGAAAKKLVEEFAFTPKTGLTVALMSDPRLGVKVQPFAETYAGVIQQETENVQV